MLLGGEGSGSDWKDELGSEVCDPGVWQGGAGGKKKEKKSVRRAKGNGDCFSYIRKREHTKKTRVWTEG